MSTPLTNLIIGTHRHKFAWYYLFCKNPETYRASYSDVHFYLIETARKLSALNKMFLKDMKRPTENKTHTQKAQKIPVKRAIDKSQTCPKFSSTRYTVGVS